MDKKLKHLELIQQVISRMGGNLFYLRGWSITLAAGLLALLSQNNKPRLFPLVILGVLVIIFWVYDGYFLALERRYRGLYDKVRSMDETSIDFSMNVAEFTQHKDKTVVYCMFSKTLVPFYAFLLGATIYLITTAG